MKKGSAAAVELSCCSYQLNTQPPNQPEQPPLKRWGSSHWVSWPIIQLTKNQREITSPHTNADYFEKKQNISSLHELKHRSNKLSHMTQIPPWGRTAAVHSTHTTVCKRKKHFLKEKYLILCVIWWLGLNRHVDNIVLSIKFYLWNSRSIVGCMRSQSVGTIHTLDTWGLISSVLWFSVQWARLRAVRWCQWAQTAPGFTELKWDTVHVKTGRLGPLTQNGSSHIFVSILFKMKGSLKVQYSKVSL